MKPVIVQHVAGFDLVGGPGKQLRLLMESSLSEKYEFRIVSQERATGGISLSLIRDMAKQIRAASPDLVHVRGLQSVAFHGLMAAKLAGCRRVLVSVHGFTGDSLQYQGWLRLRQMVVSSILEPLTLRLASGSYCVCHYASRRSRYCRYVRRDFGVIHNGIPIKPLPVRLGKDRAALGLSDADVVGIFVGRIVRDKGLFVLADALARMAAGGGPLPRIMVAGDGPDLEQLGQYVDRVVPRGVVQMMGRRNDVQSLLCASDFFLLPSLHENLSNALLEACHAGCPPIASEVGGNPEVVEHGVSGLLIAPNDSSSLAQAIGTMISRPDLRKAMGKSARMRIEREFSLDQTARRLAEVYGSLLGA